MYFDTLYIKNGKKVEVDVDRRNNGSYVVSMNGKFYCSCDDLKEVYKEIEDFKKNFNVE